MITSYPLTLSDISISIGSHLPIRPVVVDKAPHLCSSVKVGIRACAQRTNVTKKGCLMMESTTITCQMAIKWEYYGLVMDNYSKWIFILCIVNNILYCGFIMV